jgi:hypothetical protein
MLFSLPRALMFSRLSEWVPDGMHLPVGPTCCVKCTCFMCDSDAVGQRVDDILLSVVSSAPLYLFVDSGRRTSRRDRSGPPRLDLSISLAPPNPFYISRLCSGLSLSLASSDSQVSFPPLLLSDKTDVFRATFWPMPTTRMPR